MSLCDVVNDLVPTNENLCRFQMGGPLNSHCICFHDSLQEANHGTALHFPSLSKKPPLSRLNVVI